MDLPRSPLAPAHFPELAPVSGVSAATARHGFYGEAERDDVFMLAFAPGTAAAGVFTRSQTASCDIALCRAALAQGGGRARALVVNAGNSNAFTRAAGPLKNSATVRAARAALGGAETDGEVFIAATGVIGAPLEDPETVARHVPAMAGRLAPGGWEACARAFMTTDTFPKGAGARAEIGGAPVTLCGIAKGSGMIEPDMATMLSFVATDAAIAPAALQEMLEAASAKSFGRITVDSDTSTSDTLMLFATGKAGNAPVTDPADPAAAAFRAALNRVCLDLAQQVVRDGEGASRFITVEVSGAESAAAADRIAKAIANSPLVKTAMAAGDPNWGRIIMAAGKAGERLDPARLRLWIGNAAVAEGGGPHPDYTEAAGQAAFSEAEITIRLDCGTGGEGAGAAYTCDLTHGYITINSDYRS